MTFYIGELKTLTGGINIYISLKRDGCIVWLSAVM